MEQGFPLDAPWRNQFIPILFQVINGGGVLAACIGVFCITRLKSSPVGVYLLGLGIVATPVLSGIILTVANEDALRESHSGEYVFFAWLVCFLGIAVVVICDLGFRLITRLVRLLSRSVTTPGIRQPGQSFPVFLMLPGLFAFGFMLYSSLPRNSVSENARRSQCRNNLREIGLAIHAFEKEHGHFPKRTSGDPPVSWRVDLLPYMHYETLHQQYDRTLPWDAPANTPVARQFSLQVYHCPSRGRGQTQDITRDQQGRDYTDFLLVTGPGTIAANNQPVRAADIRDGLSQTAFITEASGQFVVWTEPRDFDVSRQPIGINLKGQGQSDSPGLMSSYHSNGAHMLLGDGKVRFVNEKIDPRVLKSLTTIDAGDSSEDRP